MQIGAVFIGQKLIDYIKIPVFLNPVDSKQFFINIRQTIANTFKTTPDNVLIDVWTTRGNHSN